MADRIAEGLYVPTNLGKRGHIWHRYVIGQLGGMVRYSRGGSQHFMCKVATFEKWLKRYEAQHRAGAELSDTSTAEPK